MNTGSYNKLSRDRIPEIIESDGRKCTTEVLSDDRWLQILDAKPDEDLAEYQESKSLEELEDIADCFRACYEARRSAGVVAEKANSISAKRSYTTNAVQRNIPGESVQAVRGYADAPAHQDAGDHSGG